MGRTGGDDWQPLWAAFSLAGPSRYLSRRLVALKDSPALDSLIPTIEIRGFTRLPLTPANVMYGEVKVRQKAVSDLRADPDMCPSGVALEDRLGHAYNEQAFRYLLAIEQKRSERSGCPFLLLLVDLKEESGIGVRIDPMVATKLFSALGLCLRETDVVGWYREERVAGAVLIELGERRPTEVSRLIGQRVKDRLYAGLPRSEEHTSELQSLNNLVCRLLLEKKKKQN